MKAIIPVAGTGTRLKPHTYTVPKVLIHVAGKPILGHILDEIQALGIKEVAFIVGYLGEKVEEYVRNHYQFRAKYIPQEEQLGLGHAIYLARKFVDSKESILIILGDTIFKTDLRNVTKSRHSLIGVQEVEDPRRFGVVQIKENYVSKIIEKPTRPSSNLAVVGLYYIVNSDSLFEALQKIMKKRIMTKGEYQLTDALELMIEQGEKIGFFKVDEWYDCGKPETLLLTNRRLLERNHQNYQIPGSVIIPPVYIAKSAKIENSVIGPYVSIAEGSVVRRSLLRNTIINENAMVETVLLHNSLIGDNAVVRGAHRKLNVGDSSVVDLI